MANKTVYFSAEDTQFIDEALPDLNLSLSQALFQGFQLLVEKNQAQQQGFTQIKLSVGQGGIQQYKVFWGRKLYTAQIPSNDKTMLESRRLYQTKGGKFVYYTRLDANWHYWNTPRSQDTSFVPDSKVARRTFKIVDQLSDLKDVFSSTILTQIKASQNHPIEYLDI
ncbi:MAG: EXLDI protein [Lactobacillus sp.]|jgi:EXLDI family protein|nr:EXLDI protein [Lactobacillus sp.]